MTHKAYTNAKSPANSPASLRGFFSNYSFADPATDQAKCSDIGGTFLNHPELGEICSGPAPSGYEYAFSSYAVTSGWKTDINVACNSFTDSYFSHVNANILPGFRVVTPASGSGTISGTVCTATGSAVILNNIGEPATVPYQHVSIQYYERPAPPHCPLIIGLH